MLDIPTFKEKIKNDYWMTSFVAMTVIYILFSIIIYILQPDELYISIIVLGFSVFSIIGLIARSKVIDNFFTKGLIVTAVVVKIRRFSRYPYIKMSYVINSEPIEKKIYISRGGKSAQYQEGSPIKLLVDPNNPKKAIILSFYEN